MAIGILFISRIRRNFGFWNRHGFGHIILHYTFPTTVSIKSVQIRRSNHHVYLEFRVHNTRDMSYVHTVMANKATLCIMYISTRSAMSVPKLLPGRDTIQATVRVQHPPRVREPEAAAGARALSPGSHYTATITCVCVLETKFLCIRLLCLFRRHSDVVLILLAVSDGLLSSLHLFTIN